MSSFKLSFFHRLYYDDNQITPLSALHTYPYLSDFRTGIGVQNHSRLNCHTLTYTGTTVEHAHDHTRRRSMILYSCKKDLKLEK